MGERDLETQLLAVGVLVDRGPCRAIDPTKHQSNRPHSTDLWNGLVHIPNATPPPPPSAPDGPHRAFILTAAIITHAYGQRPVFSS